MTSIQVSSATPWLSQSQNNGNKIAGGNATLTRGFLRHTSRGVITNSSDIPVLTWHWEQPNICGK
jgi:hypothetical protein